MTVVRRLGTLLGSAALACSSAGVATAQQPPAPAGKDSPPPLTAPDPAPPSILPANETPIDLGTALRLAGAQNPELQLARERVTEATAVRQLAAAQLLPTLNVGGNYDLHRGVLQQSNGNILDVRRDALALGMGAGAVGAGTVTVPGLNYNLNVGTAVYAGLIARQNVAARAAAARAADNDVLLRVCLGYTDLLRASGRRSIASRNRDEVAEVARLTAVYAKAGQGRQADADRAAVELRRREVEVSQAEADVLTASARLCQLLNLDPSTPLRPVDGWVVPAPVVPDPIPLSELIAIALLQRPELEERRADVRAALLALSNAKVLPFSPTVILGFSGMAFGGGSNLISGPAGYVGGNGQVLQGDRFGNFGGRSDLDVVAFWTLQNLGAGNVALTRAAASRARQADLRALETLNRVRAEVAEAHARVAARYAQLDLVERAVRTGGDGYAEDLRRIRGGLGLPLEVLDSFRLLSRARFEYLDTIVDYNRAQFQLYVALGRPPADHLARPIPATLVPPPAPIATPIPGQGLAPGAAPPGPRALAAVKLPGGGS